MTKRFWDIIGSFFYCLKFSLLWNVGNASGCLHSLVKRTHFLSKKIPLITWFVNDRGCSIIISVFVEFIFINNVYRDCNAVTIGELNDMLSYVNKRKNECNKLSFYLSHII